MQFGILFIDQRLRWLPKGHLVTVRSLFALGHTMMLGSLVTPIPQLRPMVHKLHQCLSHVNVRTHRVPNPMHY
jgi:hypothetical protein